MFVLEHDRGLFYIFEQSPAQYYRLNSRLRHIRVGAGAGAASLAWAGAQSPVETFCLGRPSISLLFKVMNLWPQQSCFCAITGAQLAVGSCRSNGVTISNLN
jgi:hypothetical protein